MTLKEESVPTTNDTIVSIEAPASLPGGYVLDVECNGEVFPVIVPDDGVRVGQTFEAEPLPRPIAPPPIGENDNVIAVPVDCVIPMPVETAQNLQSDTPISTTTKFTVTNPDGTETTTEETVHVDGTVVRTTITQSLVNSTGTIEQQLQTNAQPKPKVTYVHVPEGAWRTPLCECCNAGKNGVHSFYYNHALTIILIYFNVPFHLKGMCWMVMCCTFIPLGQLMQRLKLNFNGDRGDYKMTCSIWTVLWVVFLSSFAIAFALSEYALFLFFALPIYFMYALVKTRYYMRRQYSIRSCCSRCKPRNECNGCCNDCCCVLYCAPCVLCQMLKHTHDEDIYSYTWYSSTGLHRDDPQVEMES